MNKPKWVTAIVVGNSQISPNLQRVVLQSDAFKTLSMDCIGATLHLLFRPDLGTDLTKLEEGEKPLKRPYTVSDLVVEEGLIELLVVRHKNQSERSGFGSFWAQYAKDGSEICVGLPRPMKEIPDYADWYFFVGDMTAISSIEARLGKLPEDARGYTVIHALSEDDIYDIDAPKGMEIKWFVAEQFRDLYYEVKMKPWLDGFPFVWVGCEYDLMLELRRYFVQNRQIQRDMRDISGYWREEVFHQNFQSLRHADIDENN